MGDCFSFYVCAEAERLRAHGVLVGGKSSLAIGILQRESGAKYHQFLPANAVRKTRVILDVCRCRELPTSGYAISEEAFVEHRFQFCSCQVDRCGMGSRTRADYDNAGVHPSGLGARGPGQVGKLGRWGGTPLLDRCDCCKGDTEAGAEGRGGGATEGGGEQFGGGYWVVERRNVESTWEKVDWLLCWLQVGNKMEEQRLALEVI